MIYSYVGALAAYEKDCPVVFCLPRSRHFRSSDVKISWDYLASSVRIFNHNWLKRKESVLAYRIGKSRMWYGFGQACTWRSNEIIWTWSLFQLSPFLFSLLALFIDILSSLMPRWPLGIKCLYAHNSSPVPKFWYFDPLILIETNV